MAQKFKFVDLVLFGSDCRPWLPGDSNVQALKKYLRLGIHP